jgi:hypothetical protein
MRFILLSARSVVLLITLKVEAFAFRTQKSRGNSLSFSLSLSLSRVVGGEKSLSFFFL